MKFLRQLEHWFFAGPKDLAVTIPNRKGYQSSTVTLAFWLYALVMRHLTLPARFILLCLGIILPYSLIMLMPIHLLSFALAAIFAVDFILGWFMRPRLTIQRNLPKRVTAGSEFSIDYNLTNIGKRNAWDLTVDTLPLPRSLRIKTQTTHIPELTPGQSTRATRKLMARRRGNIPIPSTRVVSTFPFGLWCWGETGNHNQRLIVHPRFKPIDNLKIPIGRRYQPRGIALTSNVGDSMEFLGCRDYRDGDSLRHLHMRSWAKTGQPVVREFCEEYFTRTALVLDNHRPPPSWFNLELGKPYDPVFEAAVSFAAAITDYVSRQDYVLDLFAVGEHIYRFQSGRSLAYLENVLDILACLQPQHPDPFQELCTQVINDAAQFSGAIFILLNWDETRRHLVETVQAAGAAIRVILITGKQGPPKDLPTNIEIIPASEIHTGA